MWRTDSLEKTLMLEKIEGRRRRAGRGWDGWMLSPTQWTWVWVTSGTRWWTGKEAWCAAVHEVTKSQMWQGDWTELKVVHNILINTLISVLSVLMLVLSSHWWFVSFMVFFLLLISLIRGLSIYWFHRTSYWFHRTSFWFRWVFSIFFSVSVSFLDFQLNIYFFLVFAFIRINLLFFFFTFFFLR